VNWILFNGFANLYTIDEAAANLRAARAQRAQTEQTVWLAVRTAWIAFQDAQNSFALTDLNVRSAEANLAVLQGQLEVGKVSPVEYTDAVLSLVQARGNQAQVRANLNTARASLWQAIGRLSWE
jgi:outer membrane protein TolC